MSLGNGCHNEMWPREKRIQVSPLAKRSHCTGSGCRCARMSSGALSSLCTGFTAIVCRGYVRILATARCGEFLRGITARRAGFDRIGTKYGSSEVMRESRMQATLFRSRAVARKGCGAQPEEYSYSIPQVLLPEAIGDVLHPSALYSG